MKRVGNLWDKVIDIDNLILAAHKAMEGKSEQHGVIEFNKDFDGNILRLYYLLQRGNYKTSTYRHRIIYEPKQRDIYMLPFYPDRIIHHAVMNIIEPIWDRRMYYHSYSCRKGKGQHRGSTVCMGYVKRNPYVLKCDMSKFYPSINHDVLKRVIRRKIKDNKLLTLLDEIIDSHFPGVPIGNYLSQWFGNVLLNELDDMVKECGIRCYVRYCDDFVLFGDKKTLIPMADIIKEYTDKVLMMKLSKLQLFPSSRGVDFLGYRHFPDGKILLRKSTAKHMVKRIKSLRYEVIHGLIPLRRAQDIAASIMAWASWANTNNLRTKMKINEIKELVDWKISQNLHQKIPLTEQRLN